MSTNGTLARREPQAGPLAEIMEAARDRLVDALPGHLTPQRMAQLVSVLAYRNPKLLDCVPESLITCLIQVGTLDLDLTPGMNEAHLIPRWNKDLVANRIKGALECTFMPGYKGLEKLAVRTGVVLYVEPREVRKGDAFTVRHVTGDTFIEHEPNYTGGRGEITHVYTVAHMFDGKVTVEVMTAAEVEEIHQRSEGCRKAQREGKPEFGPWVSDRKEMMLKTVLKRHCKRFPRPSDPARARAFDQLQQAIEADNREYQTALDAPPKPQNDSGYAKGQYASPDHTAEYLAALRKWLAGKNAALCDRWQDRATGEAPGGFKEMNEHQADGHLLKWAVETGRLDPAIVPEEAKVRQLGRYVAIVYHRGKDDRRALGREMEAYYGQHAARVADAIRRKNPGLFPEPEDATQDAPAAEDESQDIDPDCDYPAEPGSDG